MYDLNIKKLLAKFDNDPEKLADAFTSQLNAELEKEKSLRSAVTNYVNAWNELMRCYIKYYQPQLKEYIEQFNPSECYEDIIALLDQCFSKAENFTDTVRAFIADRL